MRRRSILLACLTAGLTLSLSINAADINAGGQLATQCAACHGGNGVSTDPKFPNLAAQKQDYLKLQLEAFRSNKRKNALMNAIAANLSDKDIENLSAHFASLSGAKPDEISKNTQALDGSLIAFPKDFEKTLTAYHRKDYDDRKQVRYFRGNDIALNAVKNGKAFPNGAFFLVEIFAAKEDASGKLLTDADGKLIAGERKGYTSMEKQAGWGDGIADIYKNGDWRYSVYTADGSLKPGVNEAPCMACHKPLTKTDYSFTYDWVKNYLPNKSVGYSHKKISN